MVIVELCTRAGLDYRHGTGHGVGSYLNVHEGPEVCLNALPRWTHPVAFFYHRKSVWFVQGIGMKPRGYTAGMQPFMTMTDEVGPLLCAPPFR